MVMIVEMRDGDDCGAISNTNQWHEKPKHSVETFPSAALSATDPTWLQPGSNPGRRVGKPATDLLSYGTAWTLHLFPLSDRWS
jgi:hypothetical protein